MRFAWYYHTPSHRSGLSSSWGGPPVLLICMCSSSPGWEHKSRREWSDTLPDIKNVYFLKFFPSLFLSYLPLFLLQNISWIKKGYCRSDMVGWLFCHLYLAALCCWFHTSLNTSTTSFMWLTANWLSGMEQIAVMLLSEVWCTDTNTNGHAM